MKYDNKKDISPKYLLIVLFFACVLMIAFSAFNPEATGKIRQVAGIIITPLQKGASSFGGWVDESLQVFGDTKELKEENQKQRIQITNLQNELGKNEAELTELSELRSLYSLDEMYPDYNKTAARVFSVNSSGWFDEFYINKGMNDGVYVDCNVLCDQGLLGIVIESYDDYAKVRAIIDDRSTVTGEIGDSGTICSINGSLLNMKEDGYLEATNIDINAAIQEGDRVVTSNVSDRYVYGITVGYVTSISKDSNNLTKTAKITPVADFTDVKDVLVILDRKQKVNY